MDVADQLVEQMHVVDGGGIPLVGSSGGGPPLCPEATGGDVRQLLLNSFTDVLAHTAPYSTDELFEKVWNPWQFNN